MKFYKFVKAWVMFYYHDSKGVFPLFSSSLKWRFVQTLVVSSAQFNCYIAIPICESLLLSFGWFGWMKNSIILPHFAVILLPPFYSSMFVFIFMVLTFVVIKSLFCRRQIGLVINKYLSTHVFLYMIGVSDDEFRNAVHTEYDYEIQVSSFLF